MSSNAEDCVVLDQNTQIFDLNERSDEISLASWNVNDIVQR